MATPLRHPYTGTGSNVLIIEDDLAYRVLLTERLQDQGISVTSSATLFDGLEALGSAEAIDAILLDLGLPDSDGFEALRITADCSSIPVVVHSGTDLPEAALAAESLGASAFISKDEPIEDLAAALTSLIQDQRVAAREGRVGVPAGQATPAPPDAITRSLTFLTSALPMDMWLFARSYDGVWIVEATSGDPIAAAQMTTSDGWAPGFLSGLVAAGGVRLVEDTVQAVTGTVPESIHQQFIIESFCSVPITVVGDGGTGLLLGVSELPTRFRAGCDQLLRFAGDSIDRELTIQAERELTRRHMDLAKLSARVDALTGLPNARSFASSLEVEEARSRRHDHQTAIAIVDLDDLSVVNDTRGRRVGDQVISRAADVLANAIRTSDLAFRISGDRFGILAPRCGPEFVDVLRARLTSSLARQTIAASVGVASQATAGSPLIDVLDAATAQMIDDKRCKPV
ncbi:GGDEF domain-containing response regulator [Euzebya tangerina]|uniref:GGDEF domain-containing response regulator n=1 Tax=Euzebya tangerina TaxID=591198 RepID=UPI000E311144|nr:GGDEF domain-containing response regulator [Euzebya tangerina]